MPERHFDVYDEYCTKVDQYINENNLIVSNKDPHPYGGYHQCDGYYFYGDDDDLPFTRYHVIGLRMREAEALDKFLEQIIVDKKCIFA